MEKLITPRSSARHGRATTGAKLSSSPTRYAAGDYRHRHDTAADINIRNSSLVHKFYVMNSSACEGLFNGQLYPANLEFIKLRRNDYGLHYKCAEPGQSASPHEHRFSCGYRTFGTTNTMVATVQSGSTRVLTDEPRYGRDSFRWWALCGRAVTAGRFCKRKHKQSSYTRRHDCGVRLKRFYVIGRHLADTGQRNRLAIVTSIALKMNRLAGVPAASNCCR